MLIILNSDLARMYTLILRVPAGMTELRRRFENHVHSQGLCAVEKCGDSLFNVSSALYISIYNNSAIVFLT